MKYVISIMCISYYMFITIIIDSKISVQIPISKLWILHQIYEIFVLHSINIIYALDKFVDTQIEEFRFLSYILYGILTCLFHTNRWIIFLRYTIAS